MVMTYLLPPFVAPGTNLKPVAVTLSAVPIPSRVPSVSNPSTSSLTVSSSERIASDALRGIHVILIVVPAESATGTSTSPSTLPSNSKSITAS